MSDPNQPTTPPGWYPDGQGGQRWWDGTQWTEHTMPTSPLAAPEPSPEPSPTSSFDAPTVLPGAPTPQSERPTGPPPQQPPGYPQQDAYGAPQPAWQSQFPANTGGGKGKLIALIGGGAALLVVVLILLFTVVLGGSGGPGGAAKDYFDGVISGDCAAVDLMSQQARDSSGISRKDCEATGGDEYFSGAASSGCDFKVTSEKEDGDKATVEYAISGCDESDNDETGTISLVKEDSGWKVDNFA